VQHLRPYICYKNDISNIKRLETNYDQKFHSFASYPGAEQIFLYIKKWCIFAMFYAKFMGVVATAIYHHRAPTQYAGRETKIYF
jgi:hypothetical protein